MSNLHLKWLFCLYNTGESEVFNISSRQLQSSPWSKSCARDIDKPAQLQEPLVEKMIYEITCWRVHGSDCQYLEKDHRNKHLVFAVWHLYLCSCSAVGQSKSVKAITIFPSYMQRKDIKFILMRSQYGKIIQNHFLFMWREFGTIISCHL